MAKVAKRLEAIRETIEADKFYTVDEAVDAVKNTAKAKFDETIDIAIRLGVDPRHADQMVRGVIVLPNGIGKEVKVAVFAKAEKADEAKAAGADIVGDDDLVEKVKSGKVEFDTCIATPDMMAKVGTLGKVLGPKGLMPNPKLGTVTLEVKKAVQDAKSGQVEYKVEKNGIIHVGVGKASFKAPDLKENIIALIGAVNNAKPSGVKGTYVKSISVSSTMGVGIKLDINQAIAATA